MNELPVKKTKSYWEKQRLSRDWQADSSLPSYKHWTIPLVDVVFSTL